jgi:branched-chain amino acid transport system ATP-binding protein
VTGAAADGSVAIRTVDVEVSYGRIRAVQNVSIEVQRGAVTALVGANGAGKSSLLKSIAGLVPIRHGRVEIPGGTDVTREPAHERIRRLGVTLIPEGRGVFGQMTVEENLQLGMRVGAMRASSEEVEASREQVFELFPVLRERRSLNARYLSGGEQQMLTIGRALLMEPTVLLVDEPSMGLAPKVVKSIFDALREVLERRLITVLLVEQDSELALRIADYAYVMEQGRVETGGRARAVAEDPRLRAAYLGPGR